MTAPGLVRVRVAQGRQVVTDHGHHHGGETVAVPASTATEWIARGWVAPASDDSPPAPHSSPPPSEPPSEPAPVPVVPDGASAVRGRANVRARIVEELRADPDRSDRAIAAVVGCDHKTVGTVRRALTPPPAAPADDADRARADAPRADAPGEGEPA
ncbi:hypothetical protein [Actinomadura gamaensis]|uniref:Uncharacterized protein n=1 Tax=Actinomadura gamaensis TaxID=1763541 RepID=A0ABV9U9J5_9ACTN